MSRMAGNCTAWEIGGSADRRPASTGFICSRIHAKDSGGHSRQKRVTAALGERGDDYADACMVSLRETHHAEDGYTMIRLSGG